MASFQRSFMAWLSPVTYLCQTLINTSSALLLQPTTIPPERLISAIIHSTFSYSMMATSIISDFIKKASFSAEKRAHKPKGFLDLPGDIKKRILQFNNDEQISWAFQNTMFDRPTYLSIGLDPLHREELAPRSVWNLAMVNKQLLDEFFPLPAKIRGKKSQPEHKHRNITKKLLRHSIVNIRRIEDIYDVINLMEAASIRHLISGLRIWMNSALDVSAWFLFPYDDPMINDFVDELGDRWTNLRRVDWLPMVFPIYGDKRYNRWTRETTIVSRYEHLLEQSRIAEELPILAERKWGEVVWRSPCWFQTTPPVRQRLVEFEPTQSVFEWSDSDSESD